MQRTTTFKTLMLSACLVFLTACSDSDEPLPNTVTITTSDSTAGDNTAGTADTGTGTTDSAGTADTGTTDTGAADTGTADTGTADTGTADTGTTDTGTTDTGTTDTGATDTGTTDTGTSEPPTVDNSFLTNDRPQFITGLCDSQTVSEAVQSNDPAAPTNMTAGQIVAGRIDPDSATNTEHYWSVTLPAGFYHFVIDSDRVDSRSSNLGITITDLNGFAADDDVVLVRGNEVGYRARVYEFLEVPVARTITMKVEPSFAAQDYTLGIYGNGSAVPSPFFTDCPTIMPLSLSTTEALILRNTESATDQLWYQINLDASDYIIKSSAARTDGRDSNLIYEFGQVDQFGQNDRYERVSRVNEIGTNTTGLGALNRTEPGPVWIRLFNSNAEVSMEFTVEPDS